MDRSTFSQTPVQTVYQVDGKEVVLDEDGFLVNSEMWSDTLAEILAVEDGLGKLTDAHWRIIRFVRWYYMANGKAPLNSELRKGAHVSLLEIGACFPRGIRRGAWRLAGLPNLKGCA